MPQPTIPHPEWHPYCEVNFNLCGRILEYVGSDSMERTSGDLLLMGPGTPHYAMNLSYPHRAVTVFFLPLLLLEMGPNGDGARLLARCCGSRDISEQILRPPPALRHRLAGLFEEIAWEFGSKGYGSDLRQRSLLVEILVNIVRWEAPKSDSARLDRISENWMQLQKALRFVHEHYSEPVYVKDIAAASGLGVGRLQQLFHATVGVSCVRYIQWHRLSRAVGLLSMPGARITEVARAVGFETLSHFSASFRQMLGVAPGEYVRTKY